MQNGTRWGAALAASAALAAVCGGAQAQSAAGDWHGALSAPGGNSLPIGVTLKAKAGGGYEGSYTNGKAVMPVVEAKVENETLNFSVASGGSYSGRWDTTRKAWVGQWSFKITWNGNPGSAPPAITSPLVLTAGKP